jgi:hypothetical protein
MPIYAKKGITAWDGGGGGGGGGSVYPVAQIVGEGDKTFTWADVAAGRADKCFNLVLIGGETTINIGGDVANPNGIYTIDFQCMSSCSIVINVIGGMNNPDNQIGQFTVKNLKCADLEFTGFKCRRFNLDYSVSCGSITMNNIAFGPQQGPFILSQFCETTIWIESTCTFEPEDVYGGAIALYGGTLYINKYLSWSGSLLFNLYETSTVKIINAPFMTGDRIDTVFGVAPDATIIIKGIQYRPLPNSLTPYPTQELNDVNNSKKTISKKA